jgi:hypothetical protein
MQIFNKMTRKRGKPSTAYATGANTTPLANQPIARLFYPNVARNVAVQQITADKNPPIPPHDSIDIGLSNVPSHQDRNATSASNLALNSSARSLSNKTYQQAFFNADVNNQRASKAAEIMTESSWNVDGDSKS